MAHQLWIKTSESSKLFLEGCEQELEIVSTGVLKRTVNGELVSLSNLPCSKYKSRITYRSQAATHYPELIHGKMVEVGSIVRITCAFKGNVFDLDRDAVKDSILVKDEFGYYADFEQDKQRITVQGPLDKIWNVSYMPVLVMMIANSKHTIDEWNLKHQWVVELEEI